MARLPLLGVLCLVVIFGCPGPTTSTDDAGQGGGAGGGNSGGGAGGGSTEMDSGVGDAGEDGGSDSGTNDAGFDGGAQDAGADAGVDGGFDAGPSCSLDAGREDAGGYVPLAVTNDPPAAFGIWDPSIWYPADGGGGGFLSYSGVPSADQLHTRIAFSNDRGTTWTYVGNVNQPTAVTITTTDNAVCGATSCTGTWVHETSSLVYDATDPDPTRRFKVFVHSYFARGTSIHYTIGLITMFTTALPGPAAVWAETRILGWSSSSPISSTNVNQNMHTDPALSPGLAQCILISEPGALVRGSTLDVTFGCVRLVPNVGGIIDIKLLRSTDHGASWRYVSTLLRGEEAALYGTTAGNAPAFNGSNLFERNGRTYLFASPNGPINGTGDGYRGCLVFELDDVDAGTVVRCNGNPMPRKKFLGPPTYFTGPCTWADGATANNTIVPIGNLPFGTFFQLFSMPAEDPL